MALELVLFAYCPQYDISLESQQPAILVITSSPATTRGRRMTLELFQNPIIREFAII